MPPGSPTVFSKLLCKHLREGTRPGGIPGKPGRPWTIEDFAAKVGRPLATVRTWLSGARRPKYTGWIEDALFGSSDAYDSERIELRQAHEAAQRRSGSGKVIRASDADVIVLTHPDEDHLSGLSRLLLHQ